MPFPFRRVRTLLPALALAGAVACKKDEPFVLELDLHLPQGAGDLLDGKELKLVATDDAGVQTVLPLGTATPTGLTAEEVPTVPSTTVELGLVAEEAGGAPDAVDLGLAVAWGATALDGGTPAGTTVTAEFVVAPFGSLAALGSVAPNRRLCGAAMAIDSRSRVFVVGGETPGRLGSDRSSKTLYRMDLDLGESKYEPTGSDLPDTSGVGPNEVGAFVDIPFTGRVNLTATVVEKDGKEFVLVAGGNPSLDFPFAPTDQALLYDPEADALEVLEMPTPRSQHIAVAFPGGGALLYGGFTDTNFPRPTFATWAPARGFEAEGGILPTGAQHMAGAPYGQDVVVCGGDLGDADATSQTWTPQDGCVRIRPNGETKDFDALPLPLSGLALAPLPDGLLATGGWTDPAVDQVTGGLVDEFGTSAATTKAFRWTEAAGWKPTDPLNQARTNHAMVALADGRVLVIGGDEVGTGLLGNQVSPVRCAELFDPATDTFELLCDDMPSGAYPLVAARPGGEAVVFAGFTFAFDTATVDGGANGAIASTGPAAE